MSRKEEQTEGRLRSRPARVTGSAPLGLQPLMLGAARDSYLYVPTGFRTDLPAPLVLLLHGAGGHARHGLDLLRSLADAAGLLVLAPASRGHTWDLLVGHRYNRGLLGRCFLRALLGDHQRRSLHAPDRVLARVHGPGRTHRLPTRLHLPRHARRGAPDMTLRPQDSSRAGAWRLRRTLPRVRRRTHDPARDRLGGGRLVHTEEAFVESRHPPFPERILRISHTTG
jgi:hypothetical protein